MNNMTNSLKLSFQPRPFTTVFVGQFQREVDRLGISDRESLNFSNFVYGLTTENRYLYLLFFLESLPCSSQPHRSLMFSYKIIVGQSKLKNSFWSSVKASGKDDMNNVKS